MSDFEYYCEKCDYGTNKKFLWNQHLRTTLHITGHRKERCDKLADIYKCDKCDYTTTNRKNYLTHTLNNHDSKEDKKEKFKYYCETCDFGVFTESSYNKHIATKKHKMRQNNSITQLTT